MTNQKSVVGDGVGNGRGWQVGDVTGSISGGGNGSATVIDEYHPVPEGRYVAAVRLIAVLGKGDHFGAGGGSGEYPRSAWQWVVRLGDGTLATLTHLVTLDDRRGTKVRMLAAALLGDCSLLESGNCDAEMLAGRSARITVRRQQCGGERDRPYVSTASALAAGVESVAVPDAAVWKPWGKTALPAYAPPWVQGYANLALCRWREPGTAGQADPKTGGN